ALYNLTRTPEHFTGQVSSMTFSMTVSRALSNIRFVLKDVNSDASFTLTDSSGTPADAAYPYNYSMVWDGRIGTTTIPAGAYVFHAEAEDRLFGLTATSELQPFHWNINAIGTVTFGKNVQATTGLDQFIVNEDQVVSANYNYEGMGFDDF